MSEENKCDETRGHCDFCGKDYGLMACCQRRYDYLKHYGIDILPPDTGKAGHNPDFWLAADMLYDYALCSADATRVPRYEAQSVFFQVGLLLRTANKFEPRRLLYGDVTASDRQ